MNRREKRSGIINVSTLMTEFYCPGFSIYSATKIQLDYFTKAMALESKAQGKNIDVLLYNPGFVATKLSRKKESFNVIST
mmetsp:Transcript_11891/g.8671  ORF Transcript_11891/g.8671 Transcript_11891/m.8671 type:complete len:80 (+) Transcript_11891:471-710(+)